jgi:predicted CXXCH cytochrome family protein
MKQCGKVHVAWLGMIAVTTLTAGVFATALFMTDRAADQPLLAQARAQFLPGATSVGHYQIELACEACHSGGFADRAALQEACVGCHGAELREADDKHPLAKFTDPRNASLLEKIDARECVTCHQEHRPEITRVMGVTQPADFCFHCHEGIAEERPSHAGMGFETCASAGCHNFHDNRALYEDFLRKHHGAAPLADVPRLVATNFREIAAVLPEYPSDRHPLEPLTPENADAPDAARPPAVVEDWHASAHAAAGVNCTACHAPDGNAAWIQAPPEEVCGTCHAPQRASFLAGRHGMRIAQGLSALQPGTARAAMKADAPHDGLGCGSCHSSHRYSRQTAAVEACLTCHDDAHSRAYQDSPHAELWRRERAGGAPAGSGVTCASCHMPRVTHRHEEWDLLQVFVQHNQNDTLRPNEKMIRPVCLHCHGLQFSLDALADETTIRENFRAAATRRVPSIDMTVTRENQIRERRAAANR